ncbi:hypothetical protein [Bacillus testis]|nr:hypothetical protein [Bacillus testis]
MTLKIGSKFKCSVCESEFIITKLGKAELKCCGKEMEQKQ